MTKPNIQADTTPIITQNTVSDQELVDAIAAGEAKVRDEGQVAEWVEKASWVMLVVYGVLTLAIGLMTIWSNRVNSRLRITENLLNTLRMTKVKADAEAQLQVETTKVRADADNEARRLDNEAKRIEAEAKEKIAGLTAEAEEARAKIATAQVDAARATKQTAEISLRVEEEARKRAEAERALLELQERVRPRTLGKRRELFVGILKAKAKGRASVECLGPGSEACNFADEILLALNDAGWTVQVLGGSLRTAYSTNFPNGITLIAHHRGAAAPHIQALYDAFTALGFQVDGRYDPRIPEDGVRIKIGVKP